MTDSPLCDQDCNHCPIINHPNSRMLTKILNAAYDRFGDEFYKIVQDQCPNLTVCYDCRIDDFCHIEGCKLITPGPTGIDALMAASVEDLERIEGIGPTIARSIAAWFADPSNKAMIERLRKVGLKALNPEEG